MGCCNGNNIRQWHLADDKDLKYHHLADFDRDMIALCKKRKVFANAPTSLFIDGEKQVLNYKRGGITFLFNFNPVNSYEGYHVKVSQKGTYKVILSSDAAEFGGEGKGSKRATSKKVPMHGFDNSITLDLPGFSFTLLRYKPKK